MKAQGLAGWSSGTWEEATQPGAVSSVPLSGAVPN